MGVVDAVDEAASRSMTPENDRKSSELVVSIVGPESSGKTSLAERLAEVFDAPWLPEYAREYLTGRPEYVEADLETIAREQARQESALVEAGHPLVVLDTDLVVIRVWWSEKYGRVPRWVDAHLEQQSQRLYLLTRPDLPWEFDPLRESRDSRDRLFEVYVATLERFRFNYVEVRGTGEARYELAEEAVTRRRSS